MFTIDNRHRLKWKNRLVTRVMSSNINGAFDNSPSVTVMHFTYGNSAASSAGWFCSPNNQNKSSAHVVIGRDGEVIQCVDFNIRANHAGRSSWRGRSGLNRWAFGIELANWGNLMRQSNGWASWTGKIIPNAVEAVHRNGNPDGSRHPIGWEPYTEAQIEAAVGIVQALVKTYGAQEIVGHEDVSPTRKWDPGPAFDMLEFRRRVGDDLSSTDPLTMITDTPDDTLNLREGAGMMHSVIAELSHGTTVEPLEVDGNWLLVNVLNDSGAVTKTGWIYSRFAHPS